MTDTIAILDFGGQYAHLITNRIRRLGVHALIKGPETPASELKSYSGIILSGGPQSVNAEDALLADPKIFELGIPVLGICYGHQLTNKLLGGKVSPGKTKEYGKTKLTIDKAVGIFEGIESQGKGIPPLRSEWKNELTVWMSHWDEVTEIPVDFEVLAHTDINDFAAVGNLAKNIYGIQFHPEVTHTEQGQKILENFVNLTKAKKTWSTKNFLENISKEITDKVKRSGRKVFMLVSGGVDSVVAFTLLNKVLGKDQVIGLLIDTGFMRKDEVAEVKKIMDAQGFDNLRVTDAKEDFLKALKGISDPEEKRSTIGKKFIDIQAKAIHQLGLDPKHWLLGQGTIYPDTIESGGTKHADKIKTHHNRVPEIQAMIDQGLVIEPLADLYKDEVRELGEQLGLPHHLVWRHPFPGPGLAVRILCSDKDMHEQPLKDDHGKIILPIKSVGVQGDVRTYRHPAILKWHKRKADPKKFPAQLDELEELATQTINANGEINRCLVILGENFDSEFKTVSIRGSTLTPDRVQTLQNADKIVNTTLDAMSLNQKVWQFPVVLAPMVFNNSGKESIILRPVDSIDAMTARVGSLPWEFFDTVTKKILEDKSISAVFLDVTNKPPGTIEWE